MEFPYGEQATRLRASAKVDPYSGEPTGQDWSSPDELDLGRGAFDPGASTEPTADGRNAVITTPAWLGPDVDADILAGDRLRVRGRVWEVLGDPLRYSHPITGWRAGVRVNLKAVEG